MSAEVSVRTSLLLTFLYPPMSFLEQTGPYIYIVCLVFIGCKVDMSKVKGADIEFICIDVVVMYFRKLIYRVESGMIC